MSDPRPAYNPHNGVAHLSDMYSRLSDSAQRRDMVSEWEFLARECDAEISHAVYMHRSAEYAHRIRNECERQIARLTSTEGERP